MNEHTMGKIFSHVYELSINLITFMKRLNPYIRAHRWQHACYSSLSEMTGDFKYCILFRVSQTAELH